MPSKVKSFRDLRVWQAALRLGLEVHTCSSSFPASERFGLTSQVRRSAVSIASNIAEGYGRGSRADYLRFLKVARGSMFELETQLEFASGFGYLPESARKQLEPLITDCVMLLSGLIRRLEE